MESSINALEFGGRGGNDLKRKQNVPTAQGNREVEIDKEGLFARMQENGRNKRVGEW